MLATQVEEAEVTPALAVDMTVHAAVVGVTPVGEDALAEACDIALADFNPVPHLERGVDEAVGDVGVDGIGRYREGE